jgi:phosphoribosylaminoimidazolecarboxamide formyltransferase/IMP cyclohydrolase
MAGRGRAALGDGAGASEAFFPFRDGLDTCAAAEVAAVVEGAASVNYSKLVEAADELGLVSVFAGERQFQR